ncbi:MAG: CARDB domain-containing protein [Candidatus Thermoplasmatota archaeon]|nr:CARDB domain-containing protein [Candidatus Thermoplasmatota archaeon]MEC8766620.1 CARDB domain-containing protein [Candidatus Thermoplasmatota archaeon]
MEPKAKAVVILTLLLVSVLPLSAQAGESGGVQSSAVQMSLNPSNPLMGGSVDVEVMLYNSQQTDAFSVEVAFYKENISPNNRLLFDQVTIPAESWYTASTTWSGLTEGVHKIWFEFSAGGDVQVRFNKEFTVAGLANLRIDSVTIDTSTPVYAGDSVALSTHVLNSGTVDAPASKLLVQVPQSPDVLLDTPALTAGSSAWVNTTITAPSSGVHSVQVTPDAENVIEEASEMNKLTAVDLTVATRMDLSFKDGLTITTAEGALEGPWTVEGTMVRTNGTGPLDVPVWVQLPNPAGGLITSQPFTVSFNGVGYSEQPFTTQLTSSTLSSLSEGDHIVTAKINPFNEANLQQERTDNDEASGVLTIYPIPDVYVDANALPTVPSVQSGEDIEWRVTMENTGDIGVSGNIQYEFDGVQGQSPPILLDAGEAFTWTVSLSTALGAHTAEFEGQWVAAPGSWDANKQNSIATGSVMVESKLKLNWEYATFDLRDAENNTAELPLTDGEAYTLTIGLTSQETGSANYTCQDSSNTVLSSMEVDIVNRGDRASLSCTFAATASMTTVRLIPEDASISSTLSRSFATLATNADGDGAGSSSETGTVALFGAIAVALIGALVAAVVLTREREEEVERDIFEYCPACDGELEGTEDRCPHCSFNLKKARNQFHACHACGETVPDLMENCPYCGAQQDVSSFFERRERREPRQAVKEEVALPEEDENEIVTGTQNFADAVKEFGFDEEHLEEEWDTNIEAAEAEVEAAYDRRYADEIAMEDMTEEELEAYKEQVTTTLSARRSDDVQDLDSILSEKGELKSLAEETGELSASDAAIREQLFEITGEDGVLPGEKVNIGMSLTDSSFAGNEVSEATANFSFDEKEEKPPATAKAKADGDAPAKGRKAVRRRPSRQPKKQEAPAETDVCGACGADVPVGATECGVCGAKFS